MKPRKKKGTLLIKYGGNAMLDDDITRKITGKVCKLVQDGYRVVLVHGGGPFIEDTLKLAGIETEFVAGHRKTTGEAIKYVEMALKGHVNSKLVSLLNEQGLKAVGLSGKDGHMVTAEKRYHIDQAGKQVDIGFVGNIKAIDPTLLNLLLQNGYLPVVCTLSAGTDGHDYNVNADLFAGYLAGALKVYQFIMLTDVDGLMEDPSDIHSLITEINIDQIDKLHKHVIKGGMIPKTEACKSALENGAESAMIINGTRPERLLEGIHKASGFYGTKFVK